MNKALDRIFDPLRKKYVKLTPEEAVRQLFIRFLVGQRNFPESHMASEYVMDLNGMQRRADIVVFNRELKPVLIVECKAQSVRLDDPAVARQVFEQALHYHSSIGAKVIVITNATVTFAISLHGDGTFTMLKDIPSYEDLH